MNIGLFMLICMAISYTITSETVFEKPRTWLYNKLPTFFQDLLTCPTCMGFHVGWIMGIFFSPLFFLLDGFLIMGFIKLVEKISMM